MMKPTVRKFCQLFKAKFNANTQPLEGDSSNGLEIFNQYLNVLRHTAPEQWQYETTLDICMILDGLPDPLYALSLSITVEKGALGVFVENNLVGHGNEECFLKKGAHTTRLRLSKEYLGKIIFRNVSDEGCSAYKITAVELLPCLTVDVSRVLQHDLGEILTSSDKNYLAKVASRRKLKTFQINRIVCDPDLVLRRSFPSLFSCNTGKIIFDSLMEIVPLLEKINFQALEKGQGNFDANYFATYLTQSTVRVFHLAKLLEEKQIKGGQLLDVGSFIGTFSLPLKRLGWDVVAVDRYSSFDNALEPIVNFLKTEGVTVVETEANTEEEDLARLGQFNTVISMAVIEHIPHTPKFFLEKLRGSVSPNGLLALDTPNLTRYWSRIAINNDRPNMQDIQSQYFSEIPFAGHHREYTLNELVWMLSTLGFDDIATKRFDYNLLQFDRIDGQHLQSLISMINDPSQMDTILVAGRKIA